MKRLLKLLVYIFILTLCCSIINAYTLTFDDILSGNELRNSIYQENYGAVFADGFKVEDHMLSTWGHPHSDMNVMVWNGEYVIPPRLIFGDYSPSYAKPYSILSMSAYFSTDMNATIKITAYRGDGIFVTSMLIGGSGELWNNRYVNISAPAGGIIDYFEFDGIKSPENLCYFCADDMTITPVPEPSSFFTLLCGIGGISGMILRRQRNR